MEFEHACDLPPVVTVAPCTIVIFGASGDLTSRKLIPALFSLYGQGKLPDPVAIVGCGRSMMNDSQFREKLFAQLPAETTGRKQWPDFAAGVHYRALTYDLQSFQGLAGFLAELDRKVGARGNRIFDLAVPPELYPVIAELLGEAGLARESGQSEGWARIIVEKPFGRDLASSISLNAILLKYFREEQIFRIDHYLAKETVQNTLIFRFANAIFEPLWNRHHIEYVGIVAAEELGIGNRAGYYEDAGVLRDMFQNHMMQLLVLTAMEPPARFDSRSVQDEKTKVIQSLRDFSTTDGSRLDLGQYGPGSINGQPVQGYRAEPGVRPDSTTPTFALMELYIDNWRWQNVPFYLVSGKRLPRKQTRIVVQFREVPHRLFRDVLGDNIFANRLTIETYPEEAIRLTFQTKNPGTSVCLRAMTMDFVYHEHYRGTTLDAYARVLLDCMVGDHMLFWRQDGIEQSWAFLTPVLEICEECQYRAQQLQIYPAGTWGPEQVHALMSRIKDE
ncbi:MAG TPA: glucose-6-phosphate dehydrogenase [Desulfobulbaceae bacterium]|nr:glucose-6-phosphate dehydrogenase [Desulfobulbaceae bacterium]